MTTGGLVIARRTRGRLTANRAFATSALRVVLLVVVLAAWQLAVSTANLGSLVLPPPIQAISDGLQQLGTSGFWSMVGTTAELALAASCGGIVLGGLAGIALWKSGNVGRGIEELLVALYATPTIIFYPILLVLLGLDNWPVVVIGIPLAAIPTALGVHHALGAVGDKLDRVSRSLSLRGIRKYRKVLLPAVAPLALPEVRVAAMFCTLGTIAVQFVDGSSGIGYGISQAYQRFDTAAMWGLFLDTLAGMVLLNIILTRLLGRSAAVGRGPRQERPTRRDEVVRRASLLGAILVAVGAWALLSTTTSTVASPASAVQQLVTISGGPLGSAVSSSLEALVFGFLAAAIVGLSVGYVLGRHPLLRAAYGDAVAACFTVPTVIIYPLFLGIFGVGETAKITIAAVSAVIPIAMVTSESIASVDPVLLKVADSLHCSRGQAARKIVVPAVLPQLLAGLRIGFGVAFIGVVVSEMFTSNRGLGVLALTYYNQGNFGPLYGVITLIIAVALVGTGLSMFIEGRIERRYE